MDRPARGAGDFRVTAAGRQMSIIEETLRNLQERQNSVTGEPGITPIELTQSFIDQEKSKGRKLRRLKQYVVFVIVVAAIGLAATTVLDRQLNTLEKQKRGSVLAMNAIQEKLTAAFAVPDVKAAPVVADESENILPVIVAAAQAEQVSPAVPKNEELPSSPVVVSAPVSGNFDEYGWIKKGWAAISQKEQDRALAVWKEGFLSIPDRQIVLVIHIAVDRTKSIELLQKLGEGHAAFVVSAKFSGVDSYYVLSAPPGDALEAERAGIGTILGLDKLKGNRKQKILARMLASAS